MADPQIQDILGNFYSIYNLNGATFQDHFGNYFTLTSASSGLRAGGAGGGRLTLQTAEPVMTVNRSAKTSIIYTPYMHDIISLYNGTSFVPTTFTELTNDTTATSTGSAGPAAVANTSNYDLFVWLDSTSTVRLTRGPLWTSDTGRGTGAGTTELVRVKGTLLNANAITNGPAAQRGTYVGSVRSNGSAQIDWTYGAFSNGWTPGFHGVWNMYNRVAVCGVTGDTTGSWTYNSTTYQAPHANTATARFSFIRGLDEDPVAATYNNRATNAAATVAGFIGFGLDSTSALSSMCVIGMGSPTTGVSGSIQAEFKGLPGLGFHFISALEATSSSNNVTFLGQSGSAPAYNCGVAYQMLM